MTTTITPDKYCQSPQDYKNLQISDTTRAYWDSYCQAKESEDNNQNDDSEPSTGDKFAEMFPVGFIQGLLTAQGIETMSIIVGIPYTFNLIKETTALVFENGLTAVERKAAEDFIAKG